MHRICAFYLVVKKSALSMITESNTPAKFWRRLAALVYDLLLIVAVLMIATMALLPFTHGQAIGSGNHLYQLYLFVLCYGFCTLFWRYSGQTLGMKAWKIRVVNQDLQTLSFSQASLRFLLAIPSFSLVGLGYLWQIIDKQNRTWYDLGTKTKVIRV